MMSKTNDSSNLDHATQDRELQDGELDGVSGGSSDVLRRVNDANKTVVGNIR